MPRAKKPSKTEIPKKAVVKARAGHSATAVAATDEAMPAAVRALPAAAELEEEIRRRAFELYKERGDEHGTDEIDWHRAEREVRSRYG